MGKGGTTIQQPDPIDPGQAMGEYLFGKDFSSFQGVTDPELQERLIGAEARFRPQYTALELADIATMARGIKDPKQDPRYNKLQAELAGLRAGTGGVTDEEARKIAESTVGPKPEEFTASESSRRSRFPRAARRNPNYEEELSAYNAEVNKIAQSLGGNREARIAEIEAELAGLEEAGGTPGLFDLLEESSERAGTLQREQLRLQRADDVAALQEFAPQVVQAQRMADPFSTEIAERMSRRALGQLTPEEERNVQQRARQASLSRGRIGDASSIAAEALGRSDYTAQFAAPAFQMNRALAGDVGATILGRPSSAISLGGSVLQSAQAGAAGPMGPQLFDPNVGINMAMQRQSNQFGLLGAQAQADAARSAGVMGAIGGIAQGIGSAGGIAAFACWVAREVYGIENPKWIMFRTWLLNDAPSWFRNLYINHGERFARFISNKPVLKTIIRKWMNTRIK